MGRRGGGDLGQGNCKQGGCFICECMQFVEFVLLSLSLHAPY